MSLTMSKDERETFLAGLHVGVFCVDQPGRAPLATPVWYAYEPGGVISIITGTGTVKGRLVAAAGRFSLCAQDETPPYRYVTVEGPVEATEPVDAEERKAMAHRYLGEEFGNAYLEATADADGHDITLRMRPARWYTIDYSKQFG
jgi:nitroimidazol reductase NimA-like FMN-containing flavoprotein (pyridoxamine 5'-phosphate oxidase superfamily)